LRIESSRISALESGSRDAEGLSVTGAARAVSQINDEDSNLLEDRIRLTGMWLFLNED